MRRAFGVHGRWPSQGVASRLGYVKTVVMASKRCTLDNHGWEVRHCPAMVKSILGGVRWRLRQRHVSGLSYSTYTLLPPWRTNITYGSSLGGRGLSLGLFGRQGLSLVPLRRRPPGLNKLQLAVEALRGTSYVIKPSSWNVPRATPSDVDAAKGDWQSERLMLELSYKSLTLDND